MTVHDFFMEIYFEPRPLLRPFGRLIKAIDFRSWKSLDAILPRVEATKRFLADHAINPPVCRVMHDACDLTLFAPARDAGHRSAARESLGLPPDAVVLVHHGVMHPNKGNDRIVEAFHTHRDLLKGVHLLMIGAGPQFADLEALVQRHNLEDCVTLTGWLPGLPEIATALQAADIGLAMRMGQKADHFHVTSTMVHNMATGLPVLAADLTGFREVVDECVHGLFFDPDDAGSFARACRKLADEPDLRSSMGRAARERAEALFDESRLAKAYAEALLDTIQSDTPGTKT